MAKWGGPQTGARGWKRPGGLGGGWEAGRVAGGLGGWGGWGAEGLGWGAEDGAGAGVG